MNGNTSHISSPWAILQISFCVNLVASWSRKEIHPDNHSMKRILCLHPIPCWLILYISSFPAGSLRFNSLTVSDSFMSQLFWQAFCELNSLPAKSCYGGEKKTVLLAKHKDTNIPTMMEPFSPPAAWFWWTSVHHPRDPTLKGLDEA